MNNYILTLNQIHIKGCRVTCSLCKINSSNGVLIVFDMIHLWVTVTRYIHYEELSAVKGLTTIDV